VRDDGEQGKTRVERDVNAQAKPGQNKHPSDDVLGIELQANREACGEHAAQVVPHPPNIRHRGGWTSKEGKLCKKERSSFVGLSSSEEYQLKKAAFAHICRQDKFEGIKVGRTNRAD
jgi:hypothetical protein